MNTKDMQSVGEPPTLIATSTIQSQGLLEKRLADGIQPIALLQLEFFQELQTLGPSADPSIAISDFK
jgi:hypothetical protein